MTTDNLGYNYLGVAIRHPIQLFVGGRPRFTAGTEQVEQAILHRLNTPIGSLIYARNYGSELHKLQFMPNDGVLQSLLRTYIKECISKEERVMFLSCEVQSEESVCNCFIKYRNKQINEINTLVFPFYRN